MSEASQFQFNHPLVPRFYDEIFVPRFFSQWGEYLLSRVGVAVGDRLLDVATGPGTLARLAAARLGPAGGVTALDISEHMLEVARSKPAPPGGASIEYIESPAAPLRVPDAAFDVAVCQQGFQFFADRAAASRELYRALRVGGRVGIAVWTQIERNPLFAVIFRALLETVGEEAAAKIRAPFSWTEPEEVRSLLSAAGFGDVQVEVQSFPVTFEGGTAQVVQALRATPLWGLIETLPEAQRARLHAAVAREATPLLERGRFRTVMESVVATAQK